MIGALVILGVVLLVGLVLWLTHKPSEAETLPPERPEGCCGMHEVCERQPTLEPEYFDDEELDRFAGRAAEAYTEEEAEEFRSVMLTLMPSERAAWAVAVERRGIVLPEAVRDELILLIEET